MKKLCAVVIGILGGCCGLFAQNYGALSGSFETNTCYYFSDTKLGIDRPDDRFASNNYLKLDYTIGKFTMGVQFEGYYPPLLGYPTELKDSKLIYKYAMFTDRNFQILVGDFYDQFGNGLIFRSYEDRALGFNNAIEGVNASYGNEYVMLKGIWGRQRKFMDYGESDIRGLDLAIALNEVLKLGIDHLSLEGSWVARYQSSVEEDVPGTVDAFSGRVNMSAGGLNLRAEYVTKSKDPNFTNEMKNVKGNALLIDVGYNTGGFGVQAMGRRLEYMDFRSDREVSGLVSNLNYLPALTRQHEYALANLHPYAVMANGEIGGQFDVFYAIPKKSFLGGNTGLKLHFNMSAFYDLKRKDLVEYEFLKLGDNLLYRDINFDIQKNWGRKFKTILTGTFQKFNTLVEGKPGMYYKTAVGILDATYRINNRHSLRMEIQHLWTKDDQKNWAYAMLEYSVAPAWSLYAGDMYNYGDTDLHYYSGGISYSKSRTRVALSYGRNRAGYQCSGGVCRSMPAFTGLNLALTSSF